MSPREKRTIAQRVNAYLAEAPDAQFVNNKWKFWFIAVAFLSVINAGLTWLIFRDDAENYSGPVMLSVGALVAWLCVCALHYSDSANRQLARGVSAVDSIALLFVVIHFSGLLYVYGHHRTLRAAEARYEAAAEKFNVEAKQVSTDNVEIAKAAQAVARENTKRAKIENDSAYQLRKAAEAAGAGINPPRRTSPDRATTPALATSAVELEKPQKPAEISTAFLTKWDWLVRAANCAELLLAVLTLILIRNVSAKSNAAPTSAPDMNFDSLLSVANRAPSARPALATKTPTQDDIVDDTGNQRSPTRATQHPGLARLRETLGLIAFANPPGHFKVDLKPDNAPPRYLIIRLVKSKHGIDSTKHSTRAKLHLLDDAIQMAPGDFRRRLETFLKSNGFEIGEAR